MGETVAILLLLLLIEEELTLAFALTTPPERMGPDDVGVGVLTEEGGGLELITVPWKIGTVEEDG